MKSEINMILLLVVAAAVAHGLVAGYHFCHGVREPLPLDLLWKAAAMAGLYAALSFFVAMAITILKR